MSLNRKSSEGIKLYLLAEQDHVITPDYARGLIGCTYFLDLDDLVNFHQGISEFYALQYEVPFYLKEKIFSSLNPFSDATSSRGASNELPPTILFDADNFTGYWEISRNKKQKEINKNFISRDTLISNILITKLDSIKEIDTNMINRQKRISLSAFFFIGTTLLCSAQQSASSYLILSASIGLLIKELYQQGKNIEKSIKIVESRQKALLPSHSIFTNKPENAVSSYESYQLKYHS